jgi:DNA-binding NarL/FixJ family response regulator
MALVPLCVAVVSPHPVVRHGLVYLLGRHPDLVTVVVYPGGPEPDVVIYDVVDLLNGDLSGLKDLRASTAKVLALSRDLRAGLTARAIAAGADAAVSIAVTEDELLDALHGVVRDLVSGDGSDDGPPDGSDARLGGHVGLTLREVQVLTLIAQGRTNQEIARELYLSPNSIKTYVRTGYRKIGARSRSQAVSWAIRHGFPTDGG